MKQVLAVRVGAKKAVGHIVSKRWWPTVPAALGWAALGSHLQTKIWHFGVCHLMHVFSGTMFKLRQIFGTFFGH